MAHKKWLCALVASAIFLCSCGSQPIASSKAIVNAENAIEIGDNYIAGDITGDIALEQLDSILENMEYASDYTADEKSDDATKNADYYIHTYLTMLQTHMVIDNGSFGDAESFDDVKDSLNKLKETLNKYN